MKKKKLNVRKRVQCQEMGVNAIFFSLRLVLTLRGDACSCSTTLITLNEVRGTLEGGVYWSEGYTEVRGTEEGGADLSTPPWY